MKFSAYIEDLKTGDIYAEQAREPYETGSAIKSPIGALAIAKAAEADIDIENYTFTVTSGHRSNGSGLLKDPNNDMGDVLVSDARTINGSCVISLKNLVELNIIQSDCTATNVLIEYLDGKDQINESFTSKLGNSGIRLETDKLHFPGVDHSEVPFQVGITDTYSLAQYHKTMARGEQLFTELPFQVHDWYSGIHKFAPSHWLFDPEVYPPLKPHEWYHKTGSIIDRNNGGQFFASGIDAGLLILEGTGYIIAAAANTPQCDVEDALQLSRFEASFADKATVALVKASIEITQTSEALAISA